jgi:hypothetical protein
MANYTRTAQIKIDVDDKSIRQLNDEIKELERSMKDLKVGTEEWNRSNQKLGDLKNQFITSTNEAKKLQNVVANISSEKQIRAISNLGRGMVGAFAAVSSSLRLINTDSEVFNEMTAKATNLIAVMAGLSQVSLLFNKTTTDGLKKIGLGFKSLVVTVKTSTTAMKAAIAATGLGLLVIAVSALIANWDKLKGAISGTAKAEKKAYEQRQKDFDATIRILQDQTKAYEEQARIREQLNEFQQKEAKDYEENSRDFLQSWDDLADKINANNTLLQTQADKYEDIGKKSKTRYDEEKINLDE